MQITKLLSILCFCSLFLISCATDDKAATENITSANRQVLGSSARDLLSDANFKSLRVEIVSVAGFEPTAITVAAFEEFLQARLFKPDGIEIIQRSIPTSGEAPFDINEIAAIENNTRQLFNQGDEIAVYIYFADGGNENNENNSFVLGTAYRNTSIVVYEETLRNVSLRGNIPLPIIETTILNHEFAHLMGLVNNGTPLQTDHEDTENEGHCNVSRCLMEASIEFEDQIMDMMGPGPVFSVPSLDAQCIADLQANGGR